MSDTEHSEPIEHSEPSEHSEPKDKGYQVFPPGRRYKNKILPALRGLNCFQKSKKNAEDKEKSAVVQLKELKEKMAADDKKRRENTPGTTHQGLEANTTFNDQGKDGITKSHHYHHHRTHRHENHPPHHQSHSQQNKPDAHNTVPEENHVDVEGLVKKLEKTTHEITQIKLHLNTIEKREQQDGAPKTFYVEEYHKLKEENRSLKKEVKSLKAEIERINYFAAVEKANLLEQLATANRDKMTYMEFVMEKKK